MENKLNMKMKKIIILLSAILAVAPFASAFIPDELTEDLGETVFSVTDPEYEWSQTETKQVKVELKSQALVLESKSEKGFAFSVSELPINVEDMPEFIFGFNLKDLKIDNDNKFGMIFDYQDIRNYKGISISKKHYEYFIVKDGVYSAIKTGLVKYKGNDFNLILRRENGGIKFILNGLEVCMLRKITLTSSYFGVFVSGKAKAKMPDFIMYIPEQEDTEQSTSNI